jgi:hypothetical protein
MVKYYKINCYKVINYFLFFNIGELLSKMNYLYH